MKKRYHGGGVLNDASDPFSDFQISERRSAKKAENRSLTTEQAAAIECTAEWRNKRLNVGVDAGGISRKAAAKNKEDMIEIEGSAGFERERC